MRLWEITSKFHDRASAAKLDRRGVAGELSSYHGFEPLSGARGDYSSILVHPSLPYIIKLFDQKDTGYMRFLEVAGANQANPHFPRLRGKPMRIGEKTVGIRMERLSPMSVREFEDIEYMLYQMSGDPGYERTLKPDGLEREFLDRWPRFSDAIALLRRAKTPGLLFDWHDGNLMKRADGTPVITDPFETAGDESKLGS